MIKEAIDRLLQLALVNAIDKGGRTWARGADGRIEELVDSDHVKPDPLHFFYLPGFVEYCRTNPDGLVMDDCLVVVCDYDRVELVTTPNPANCNRRFCYAVATYRGGRFEFDHWRDQEEFLVGLQTRFVETENLQRLRQMASRLSNATEAVQADDGMAQRLTVKTGVTTVDQIKIENPIVLQPWATFEEVPQPEGVFVLRLRKNEKGVSCCLYESNTDSWRMEAVGHIRDYLRQELPEAMVVLA